MREPHMVTCGTVSPETHKSFPGDRRQIRHTKDTKRIQPLTNLLSEPGVRCLYPWLRGEPSFELEGLTLQFLRVIEVLVSLPKVKNCLNTLLGESCTRLRCGSGAVSAASSFHDR